MIVDSTRKGKRFPDSMSKTIPIWTCVLNRAIANYRSRSSGPSTSEEKLSERISLVSCQTHTIYFLHHSLVLGLARILDLTQTVFQVILFHLLQQLRISLVTALISGFLLCIFHSSLFLCLVSYSFPMQYCHT